MNSVPLVPDISQLDLSILCPDIEDLPELAARWAADDARAGEEPHTELFQSNQAAVIAYEEAYAEMDALLAEIRAQPIVRLSDEQMAEIEDERIGAELCEAPWRW